MLAVLTLLHSLQQPAEPAVPEAPPPAPLPRWGVVERTLLTLPEAFDEATLFPAFAPGGARVAVTALLNDGRSVILADGVVSEPHDDVRAPRFSADGKQLAWVWGDRGGKNGVKTGEKIEEVWELYLDGKRVKKAQWIGQVVFSPVGDDYAVWTGEGMRLDEYGDHEGGEYTCTWGRKKADGFSDVPWQDPKWSADGKHLGFIGQKPSRMMAVMDGKEFGPYYFASGFTWSPDGKTAAWTARPDYDKILIFSGKKMFGGDYESVGGPALGPDDVMAYTARVRGRAVVVFREAIVPGFYDDLGTPAVSPNGKGVAVAANMGRKQEYVGWFVDNSWMDGSPDWNENQAAVAAAAAAGSVCFLVVDGVKFGGDWWRVVLPFFSPDSRHVAARAQSAEGWQVLLDDRASPAYDAVDAPRFSADSKLLEFGARRGREMLWVQIAVP